MPRGDATEDEKQQFSALSPLARGTSHPLRERDRPRSTHPGAVRHPFREGFHRKGRIAQMKRNLLMLLWLLPLLCPPAFLRAQERDLPERDEFRQSYPLPADARVEVKGINGSVTIETAQTSTAEVHIVRSAHHREDLEFRKVIVERTGNRLVVRGEEEHDRGKRAEVRQRVMLRLPRQVALNVHGINGSVSVGEIEREGVISGVNGKVDLAQVGGTARISGINGSVSLTVARLGEQGLKVSGVNGKVEVQFAGDINADLQANGVNGKVETDLPTTTVSEWDRASFKAKIGSGGSPISISGVNGRVSLRKSLGSF
jgi:hypothetical protein